MRLGPFVIYDGTHDGGRHRWYAFLAEPFEPAKELVVTAREEDDPSDPWTRIGDTIEASANGLRCSAGRARRGVSLVELMVADLPGRDRLVLALGVAHELLVHQHRHPPKGFPRIEPSSTLVSWRGEVVIDAIEPCLANTPPVFRWQMQHAPRHATAAAIAGCAVGENSFRGSLDAARKVVERGGQESRSALVVELLAFLLEGDAVPPPVIERLQDLAPNPAELGGIAQRGAQKRFLDDEAWDRDRATLTPMQVRGVRPLDVAHHEDASSRHRLLGPYLVGREEILCGWRTARATPIDGPPRDVVVLIAERDDVRAGVAFPEMLDMDGKRFSTDATQDALLAARDAAPHALRPEHHGRALAALAAARAATLATPFLIVPSLDCLKTTSDGRVSADGFEPGAGTRSWSGGSGSDRWRYEWAKVVVGVALGTKNVDSEECREGLEKVLAGASVRFSDAAALDATVCRAICALRDDASWLETRARVMEIVGPEDLRVHVAPDPAVDARRTFIERERDAMVAVLRKKEDAVRGEHEARSRTSRVTRLTDGIADAAAEARAVLRESWTRWRP